MVGLRVRGRSKMDLQNGRVCYIGELRDKDKRQSYFPHTSFCTFFILCPAYVFPIKMFKIGWMVDEWKEQ